MVTFKEALRNAKSITLIGSRKTTERIDDISIQLGEKLSNAGLTGYSGGAPGMDSNFMKRYQKELSKIILPSAFSFGLVANGKDLINYQELDYMKARSIAQEVAGNFDGLSESIQHLFSRNVVQVLRETIDNPTDLCLFWAKEQYFCVKGGTAIAIRVARRYNVPCFNLWRENVLTEVCSYLGVRSSPPTLDFLYD